MKQNMEFKNKTTCIQLHNLLKGQHWELREKVLGLLDRQTYEGKKIRILISHHTHKSITGKLY